MGLLIRLRLRAAVFAAALILTGPVTAISIAEPQNETESQVQSYIEQARQAMQRGDIVLERLGRPSEAVTIYKKALAI